MHSFLKKHGGSGMLSQQGRKHKQQIAWKALLKLFFLSVLTVLVCCGGELCVRYCVALTLNPGQTGKWHLEREPDSSWPVLHPFSLECRWKHEPALWIFLAPSSMAVNGPLRSPICNWFESCALQRYCLRKIMMNVMHQPVASGCLTLKKVEQTLKIIPAGFGSCHSFLYLNLAHTAA